MKYTFNNTNIITGYIKELLQDFNLPIYTVYREDKPVYDGKLYLKDNSIVQAIYNRDNSNNVIYVDGKPSVRFVTISNYTYGNDLGSGSTNFKIKSTIYDKDVHYYLGDYLRFLRDYRGLNLMSLYNCFGYEVPVGLNYFITTPGNNKFVINTEDTNYNYYIIPAKFNEKYTIAIDTITPIEACGIIYTGDSVLNVSKELSKITYKKLSTVSMLNPAIFSLDIDAGIRVNIDEKSTIAAPYYDYEKCLRILLKIPKTINSTIVILEGVYRNNYILGNRCTTYISNDQSELNSAPTYHSLIRLNDGNSYPFADRLIEYLLFNTIDNNGYIKNNISRLQSEVYKQSNFRGLWDLWDDKIRDDIYVTEQEKLKQTFFETKVNKFDSWVDSDYTKMRFLDLNQDLLAYGDKDVEGLLSRS